MKMFVCALTAASLAVVVGGSARAESPREALKARLVRIADSPSFYWAWTDPWLNRCGAGGGDLRHVDVVKGVPSPKPLKDTVLQNAFWHDLGAAPVVGYTDISAIVGGTDDKRLQVNRAALSAVIRKAWQDHQGVTVFTWHLASPCVSRRGVRKGSYRYICPEHPNLVKSILCGETLSRAAERTADDETPHVFWVSDPRSWFLKQVEGFAAFLNTLTDEQGRKIPVIVRYLHEMDSISFWWGDTHCSQQEYIDLCRLEATTLRKLCGDDQILFAYTPDRWWQDLGSPADGEKHFLSWYPGDEYVDVVGFDDYSIGRGKTKEEFRPKYDLTLEKMRTVSAFAKEHGKVAALTETGCSGARDEFYLILHRLMTEEGVHFAFVDTWHGENFMPATDEGKKFLRAFLAKPEVQMLRTKPEAFPLTFSVKSDHTNALYRCGEEAVLTVTALDGNGHPAKYGEAAYSLDNFGPKRVCAGFVDLAKENPFVVKGTLSEPGFLRLKASRRKNKGPFHPFVWSVGFEPEKIEKGSPSPADFDAFWTASREKLSREVPLDARVERIPERCTKDFDFFRISFATFGRRVYGYMSVPTDATKSPYPVDVGVAAAGFGNWSNDMAGRKDSISVYFSVYPFEPHWKWQELGLQREYDGLAERLKAKYGDGSYRSAGLAVSREDYFFYPVILGLDRAIDWIAARPDVDSKRIRYQGTSQGGGLGLYLAGLNPRFSKVGLYVPALTDTMGFLKGRQSGWPSPVEVCKDDPARRRIAEANAPYFDGANFAARIRCPVRVAVGFADVTCPPCAVYSAFNQIPSKDKAILNGLGMSHSCWPNFYGRIDRWIREEF